MFLFGSLPILGGFLIALTFARASVTLAEVSAKTNQAAPVNAPISSKVRFEQHWRRVTEQRRSAKMLDTELENLKDGLRAVRNQQVVRENLHPVDSLDATDFVRDIESDTTGRSLFQSAIPYFALLTDEARLPFSRYLGTRESPIRTRYWPRSVSWKMSADGCFLRRSAPVERDAVTQLSISFEMESMRRTQTSSKVGGISRVGLNKPDAVTPRSHLCCISDISGAGH